MEELFNAQEAIVGSDVTARWLTLKSGEWRTAHGVVLRHDQDVFRINRHHDEGPEPTETRAPDLDALVKELADLEVTPSSVSQFVRAFGTLGVPIGVTSTENAEPHSGGYLLCEQLDAWNEAVMLLRIAWRAFQGEEQRAGEALLVKSFHGLDVRVGRKSVPFYTCQVQCALPMLFPRPMNLPALNLAPPWNPAVDSAYPVESDNPDLPQMPTWTFAIEGPLTSGTVMSAAIGAIITHYTSQLVGAEIRNNSRGLPALTFASRNLLGEAWMRFGELLSDEELTQFARCPECGRAYRKVRRQQRTCGSSRCRGRIHSRNRDRARVLADSGLTCEAIAAEMSTADETVSATQVESWVESSRKRRKN